MKKNSVKLNYIYNLAFQVFAMITPLITTPYISRVLLADGVGRISFSLSVITYFNLLAALGFSTYAQREIAKKQGDKEQQTKIFWEIIICRGVITLISVAICWMLLLIDTFDSYSTLIGIMSMELIATMFNIAFFFQGNEEFRLIAVRDFIIRIIGIVLIFALIRGPEDINLYAVCTSGTSLLSAIVLWPTVKGKLSHVCISELAPFKHFLPSLRLFIPTIAISLFTILDKILIGILIPGNVSTQLGDGTIIVRRIADIENGYYSQSERIIKLSMMVLASLSTVMMPRNSKELEDGNYDKFNSNIKKALTFVFFVGAPISAGIIAISKNFSPWFFGEGYDKVPFLMIIFAFMVIPAGIGNVLGQQYLIPKGEDKKYVVVYVVSGLANLCMNTLFIPKYFSYGAAIASVIAESIAPIIMFIYLRNDLKVITVLRDNWKPLISSGIMCSAVYFTGDMLDPTLYNTFIMIFEGVIIYLVTLWLFRYEVIYEVFKTIKRRVNIK